MYLVAASSLSHFERLKYVLTRRQNMVIFHKRQHPRPKKVPLSSRPRDRFMTSHAPDNSVDTLELDLAKFDHVAHVCAHER
jgi:hypothetical protein